MLGMMNCQTENYEFYASPSSSALQLRQDGIGRPQQSVEGLEVFSSRKQKPLITYTADGRRLIDGKMGEESRQEPDKLWNRAIVDNLTARRLRRERSNRKEDDKVKEGGEQLEDEEEREKRTEGQHNGAKGEAVDTCPKQKNRPSLSNLLSKLKPRKKSYQHHKTTDDCCS